MHIFRLYRYFVIPAILFLFAFFVAGCHSRDGDTDRQSLTRQMIIDRKIAALERFRRLPVRETYEGLAGEMVALGLVNIRDMDPSLCVELAYAGPDNFLDTAIYGSLDKAFLLMEAAAMLSIAQDELRSRQPGYSLLIYDAARPLRVQRAMWNRVQGTPNARYVADPAVGSLHNYGAAVDLTICDTSGKPLDMGTAYDHFGDLAQPRFENQFLRTGDLTENQVRNRKLLREVMKIAGFNGIPNEWWHFNAFSINKVRQNYQLIE